MDGEVEGNEAQMKEVFQRWRNSHDAQVQHMENGGEQSL